MSPHISETRTEDLVCDLLAIRGWLTSKPPKGRLVRRNEYKAFAELSEIFEGKGKTGRGGDAYPDFLTISDETKRPQIVIEAKADEKDFEKAMDEASLVYGDACREAGHSTLAIGVAGQEKTTIRVGVRKFHRGKWESVCYEGKPISWIPTSDDTVRLLSSPSLMDLAPVVPKPEVLADKADLINRILREATVKDEYRPAYVGAMMLALWQSRGALRKDPEFVLHDINSACELAYSKAGKSELAKSLHIDEANTKLADKAWQILATLEKLNVATAFFAHDYLGQLYETFFRYTGGNTIGQYFTPRHIARFMADICETTNEDVIIDPACGTGGFLIAALQRAFNLNKLKYEDVVNIVRHRLIGYEDEPITAALCVANMILRGDGKAGVRKADCFRAKDYPVGKCDVALMNPPFPHKKTDVLPQQFVERALEALNTRGKFAVILPSSLLAKKATSKWRQKILSNNSLLAVAQMPDELFQPYASATTSVVLLEKGIPHSASRKTAFVRVQYDGLTLKKGARLHRKDGKNDLFNAVDAIVNKRSKAGFSGIEVLPKDGEWSPGAYIPSAIPGENELKSSIDVLLRRLVSFYIRYAKEVSKQRELIKKGELNPSPYRNIAGKARIENALSLPNAPNTIGAYYDILYGQKELHSREHFTIGDSLVVSPTEDYNGCYGWLEFSSLIAAPFVTVAQTGSIGEAFVQMEPCGVNDDCLILLPKERSKLPDACLFIAAAIIRLEKWRFSYGRKLTPSRICGFPMSRMPKLEQWVTDRWDKWKKVVKLSVDNYEQ